MLDILLDAGLDSAKMLPFLYLAYLLIEWIERTRGSRIEALLAEGSRWGAAVSALLGTIPQCGFSAMAASLVGSGVITLGTLIGCSLLPPAMRPFPCCWLCRSAGLSWQC